MMMMMMMMMMIIIIIIIIVIIIIKEGKTPSITTNDIYYIYGKTAFTIFRPRWVIAL